MFLIKTGALPTITNAFISKSSKQALHHLRLIKIKPEMGHQKLKLCARNNGTFNAFQTRCAFVKLKDICMSFELRHKSRAYNDFLPSLTFWKWGGKPFSFVFALAAAVVFKSCETNTMM